MHPEAVGLPGHGGAVSFTGESWRPLRRLRGAVDASLGDVLGAGKRICAAVRHNAPASRFRETWSSASDKPSFQKENIR
ncbi:hypothetical protein GQ55_9G109100 [Panicum hallii var. hallii]|uniref:Uncharacterized protein n=1 Tax=Panicum hallii var. hallii TaxID=1504633 RepID=A0A2T7C1T7_9POAL|nr:hypothetical protein GQ55_9G109100 [Panicum hallii var. hallii]